MRMQCIKSPCCYCRSCQASQQQPVLPLPCTSSTCTWIQGCQWRLVVSRCSVCMCDPGVMPAVEGHAQLMQKWYIDAHVLPAWPQWMGKYNASCTTNLCNSCNTLSRTCKVTHDMSSGKGRVQCCTALHDVVGLVDGQELQR